MNDPSIRNALFDAIVICAGYQSNGRKEPSTAGCVLGTRQLATLSPPNNPRIQLALFEAIGACDEKR